MSVTAVSSQKNCCTVAFEKACHVVEKVAKVALKILEFAVGFAILFLSNPCQYFGSKFHTLPELVVRTSIYVKRKLCGQSTKGIFRQGYSLVGKNLPKEHTKEMIHFARLYAATHKTDPTWLPAGSLMKKIFFDEQSGLKMAMIEEKGAMHVVFGAIGAGDVENPELTSKLEQRNIEDGAWNILGDVPRIYQQALAKVEEWSSTFGQEKVVFSGQCFGGSLAAYVALKRGDQAVCLNSFGLGAGLQWDIGRDRLAHSDQFITQISVESDMMSGSLHPLPVVDSIINCLGIRTIGNFGKRFSIPHPKEYNWNFDSIHRLILGSLIAYDQPEATVLTRRTMKDAKKILKAYPRPHAYSFGHQSDNQV